MEVTKPPKPLMERVAVGDPASRQAVTCVNAEQALKLNDAGADPANSRGRPQSLASGKRLDPSSGPAEVLATACLYTENGRNTGDPRQWVRDPTGRPRGTGRAVWGVGEVHSTEEAE